MSEHPRDFDVLVVGGGPAGMAAASRAAEHGSKVGIVDDNAALGGQIWRGGSQSEHAHELSEWTEKLQRMGVTRLCGLRVFHQPEVGVLLAERNESLADLRYRKLILATGARERFLPFPGWTLPNVLGAGGLQAMVKSGLPIHGKRAVVAGTGPLLVAVASFLRKQGADVLLICEQASWAKLARMGASLLRFSGKFAQALQLRRELAGIPFATNSWPVAAHGRSRLESVTLSRSGRTGTFACDYLAIGFHLVPNVELAALLGCRLNGGYVSVDDFQQTSITNVFCAGEPTGIGGLESALVEGQIAGLAAVGREDEARTLFATRQRTRRFTALLDKTFELRSELRNLANADTIVCRCEDISRSRLEKCGSWRAAKLHTRYGMGPCQGRVCGPAVEFIFGWKPDSVRPPVFPARVQNLAAEIANQDTKAVVSGGNA